LNWATATRSLRKLKARIIKVGGLGANENNPRSRLGGSKTMHNGSSFSGGWKYSGR
jgi:hypothetical protein